MNEEQLKQVLADESFVASLLDLETPQEVQAALKEKGIDLELADIEAVKRSVEQAQDGELSDDDLEDVAGGSISIGTVIAIGAAIVSVVKLAGKVHEWTRRRW